MTRTRLDELRDRYLLSRLSSKKADSIDASKLEADFIEFSAHATSRKLTASRPQLYKISGVQKGHVKEVLSGRIESCDAPDAIDIAGGFQGSKEDDLLIFVSMQQLNSSYYSKARSYLNPIVEQVYKEGAGLVTDFSINEALCGKLSVKRGSMALEELAVFPEQFSPGPYTIQLALDTTQETVKRYRAVASELECLAQNPKEFLLAALRTDRVAEQAIELRNRLGSLSRYSAPKRSSFSATTNSYIDEEKDVCHLYSEKTRRNIVVYFQENPFEGADVPKGLLVLDGNDSRASLAALVLEGIYEPSDAVLRERLSWIDTLYEQAARQAGRPLDKEHPEFAYLRESLKKLDTQFARVLNPDMRKNIALMQAPETLEFIACPAVDDPVVHHILPRLSWNSNLRLYHNSKRFKTEFGLASEEEQKQMLANISSSILFNNQQNNNVNLWLYDNYGQVCTDAGLSFDIKS